MHPRLKVIFDSLETQRDQLLSEIRPLSPEALRAHPPGKWSVGDIISHLIAAERLSLLYLRKKILGVDAVGNAGMWEDFKMVLLRISQRMPGLKFKAPQVVVEHTRAYENFDELEKEWDGLRTEWKAFLAKIPEGHIKKKIYRHAVAGRMNVQHALLFLKEHIIHHWPQIKRLKSA